jgi:hypothetical protein
MTRLSHVWDESQWTARRGPRGRGARSGARPLWLEKKTPEPSLLEGPLDLMISQAGRAMGVIDGMVHIAIGVLRMDPDWGETRLGLRRPPHGRQRLSRDRGGGNHERL